LKTSFRRPFQGVIQRAEALFDAAFSPAWNPLRQLGTVSFFLFWIVAVTGIYVFIFFETSVSGAYSSIEYMTHDQWYLAGVMRSLHRYASDAMVVTTVVHLVREFIFDRYRGVRWFAWFTGVPILWFLYFSGISGYWLVWDQLAQYVAVGSMEWLDWLGIFGEPVANNFLTPESITDRFFSLLVFIHIFVPLFLLFIMWIHVLRVTQPKINPPRGLALSVLFALTVLSLYKPALSHPPANLAVSPTELNLDWFYMLFYPPFDKWGSGALWGLALALSVIVAAMPLMPPLRKPKAAAVILEKCNGCTRCYLDCPFGAIKMQPRSDGRPFEQEAVVDPGNCTACGICVGACPLSTPFRSGKLVTAIDLPELPLDGVRGQMKNALKTATSGAEDGKPAVIVIGCDHGVAVRRLEGEGVAGISLPCIGMLPPGFIDYALSRGGADGVVLAGCAECGCFNRLGNAWVWERMEGLRDPFLRRRVPRERICTAWMAAAEGEALASEIDGFRNRLSSLPPANARPDKGAPRVTGNPAPAEG